MTDFFKMKWGFIALVSIVFCLSSCDDDDDKSIEEMIDEVQMNGSDILLLGLYGQIKTITIYSHEYARWKNGAIDEGNPTHVTINNYDANGFLTESEYMRPYREELSVSGKRKVVSRDNKNRKTEEQFRAIGLDGNLDYIVKTLITYDDDEKTAIQIDLISYDGGKTFEEARSKVVYKLNKYGKIDYDNYSYYVPESEMLNLKSSVSFKTIPYEQNVREYDNMGNPILAYTRYNYASYSTTIYGYFKRTYIYY